MKKHPKSRCWYCDKNTADIDSKHSYEMHKLLKRKMSFAGFGLQHKSEYQKTTVDIPRCNDCASLQAKAILAGFIVYGILIAIFFVQVILPMPNIEIDQKIIGLVLSVIFGSPILFLLNWIWGKFFHNKLRSEWDYPEVVELRKDGWAEGSEPIYKGADYDREKES